MAIYTVYAPPGAAADMASAGRIRFIREGFAFWALVLPGLWFLWHRLWLAFLGWLAVMIGFELMGRGAGDSATAVIAALFGLFLAIEARDIQRWTLERRGWRLLGVVEGSDLEIAERRFFEAWLTPATDPGARDEDVDGAPSEPAAETVPRTGATDAAAGRPATGIGRPRPVSSGVIGLFPDSGGRG